MTPDQEHKLFWRITVIVLMIITALCAWELIHGRGFVI